MESELHAVYLVTPFSVCYQLQEIDWLSYLDMWEKLSSSMRQIGTLVGVKESFLVKAMRGGSNLDYKLLQIHKRYIYRCNAIFFEVTLMPEIIYRFYTALALMELVNETPINDVAVKYKFSRGVLQSLQQMTSTFAGIVTAFCRALNWEMLALIISQFQERLYFGVQQELVDLMKIPILNGQRARALHTAGFQTLIDIANADLFAIERCLHDCISFDSRERDGENKYDADQRNKERSLFVTGKSGLSVTEAAKMIIQDARIYLENEMRINNVNWANTAANENDNEVQNAKADAIVVTDNANQSASVEMHEHEANNQVERIEIPREMLPVIPELPTAIINTSISILQPKTPVRRKSSISNNHRIEESDNEDAIDDIISFDDDKELPASNLLETSHILNDSKTESKAGKFNHIKIIDVFKNRLYFLKFEEDFEQFSECALSLAIQKQNPLNKSNAHNCAIADSSYIAGIAICIEANVAFYLNMQEGDDLEVAWNQRVDFVSKLLSRSEFTLKICDAKNQLKMLLKAIPEMEVVACSIEDPKVAHWLLQPEMDSSIGRMVRLMICFCIILGMH